MKLRTDYARFWIFIPFLLVIPLIFPEEFKLIVYTDHYNISPWSLVITVSAFLFLSGVGYFILKNREMNERMTRLHKKITFSGLGICLVIFMILLFKNRYLTQAPKASELPGFTFDQFLALTFVLGIFFIFIGSMYYVVNFIVTTFFAEKNIEE